MHVCMECFESYDRRFLMNADGFGEVFCPKSSCQGEVVELDELIAPTIILLNQKGYLTKFCCSGHWYEESSTTYIYFYDEIPIELLPEGFVLEDDYEGNATTIRTRYGDTEENKYDFVIRVNKQLYEWANNLPDLYEEVD